MYGWKDNIRRVRPYIPGEQPELKDMIKLNTNENPYPPAPAVERILRGYDAEELNRYPDPSATLLVDAIAKKYDLRREEVFVGVGSDDVLAMSFMTFFHSNRPLLFPDISYSFYDVWAETFDIPYRKIPLDDYFEIHSEDYAGENGGIIIPNPNAPTGIDAGQEKLEQIIRANPNAVVIIDEAYVDFGAVSLLPLIDRYDNLLVVQTFSKSRALAGSRIGFAMGNPELICALWDVRNSFNSYTMDRITQKLGAASIEDEEYFQVQLARVVASREWTKKELRRLGFYFPDSRTNFIFARHERLPAIEIFHALKEAGILVRHFALPKIDNYLRISIGTDQQMQDMIRFLDHYLADH